MTNEKQTRKGKTKLLEERAVAPALSKKSWLSSSLHYTVTCLPPFTDFTATQIGAALAAYHIDSLSFM